MTERKYDLDIKRKRGRPTTIAPLLEVERRYEESIERSSVSGECHLWKITSDFRGETEFWNEKGILVKSHVWKYERTHGPIPIGKKLWRICDESLCHNEEHWQVDRVLSNKEKQIVRDKFRKERLRTFQIMEEHNISLAFLGHILRYEEPV